MRVHCIAFNALFIVVNTLFEYDFFFPRSKPSSPVGWILVAVAVAVAVAVLSVGFGIEDARVRLDKLF